MSACARAPRARRGILVVVGGSHAPRDPPAPARRAQRARAGLAGGSEGLWCAARPATAERDPHADGARARADVGRHCTWCQDPPNHGQHARRARGGRAGAARKVVATQGGGIQRKAPIEPLVVRAEGPTRVRGGLSSGGQASNLYQGGWNTISAFYGATPNLSLQCSMPAGHVPSRAVRLTLRRTRIHSSHLWRL